MTTESSPESGALTVPALLNRTTPPETLPTPWSPTPSPAIPAELLRTRAGGTKRRFSLDEKLRLLDPVSPIRATRSRLRQFMNLFAFRRSNAIYRFADWPDRTWSALKGSLGPNLVARHLLADRVPGLRTMWVGARGLAARGGVGLARYICLDIDADRGPAAASGAVRAPRVVQVRPSFNERQQQVERALRRLGLDPANPRDVLTLPTPGGGLHLYVFLDQAYLVNQIRDLLTAVGLTHRPGQVEIYPAPEHGLRLPFGLRPGHPHDPRAWVQFIDDHANGWIRRFSLETLDSNLGRHRSVQARRIASVRRVRAQQAAAAAPAPAIVRSTQPGQFAPTRAERQAAEARTAVRPDQLERYRALVEQGPQTTDEARELMNLGILEAGTRTAVLKHLAAHLIWFRGQDAEEATKILTEWALDPRHQSEEIRADLERGTRRVAEHIERMCRWYAEKAQPRANTGNGEPHSPEMRFAPDELRVLRPGVLALPPEDRPAQAEFLLRMVNFARRHGQPAEDRSGWEAAPAVRQVIRRWPGCHHMNYKRRVEAATAAGVLRMAKDRWHNPRGPGRARTYHLAVPIAPEAERSLEYADAVAILTGEGKVDIPEGRVHRETAQHVLEIPPTRTRSQEHEHERDDEHARTEPASDPGADPTHLRPAGPRVGLEPGPRERNPEPAAAGPLPGRAAGPERTIATQTLASSGVTGQPQTLSEAAPAAATTPLSPVPELDRFIREMLATLRLHPEVRQLLSTPAIELSVGQLAQRGKILEAENDRRWAGPASGQTPGNPALTPLSNIGLELLIEGGHLWVQRPGPAPLTPRNDRPEPIKRRLHCWG